MENRVRREKISLEKFGYYLFTLLNSKDDGYDSLTELIKDFMLFLILKIKYLWAYLSAKKLIFDFILLFVYL